MDNANVFQIKISDKRALTRHYMSFLTGGGLFIPTKASYALGDEVFLLISLPDEFEVCATIGRIAWITPDKAQNQRPAGIGLQIQQSSGHLKARIDSLLAGSVSAGAGSLTL